MAANLNTKAAAEWLGVKPSTLRYWRMTHTGPSYSVLSERLFVYPVNDLVKWVADRQRVPSVRAAQKESYANRS